jgi:hypothetical protein
MWDPDKDIAEELLNKQGMKSRSSFCSIQAGIRAQCIAVALDDIKNGVSSYRTAEKLPVIVPASSAQGSGTSTPYKEAVRGIESETTSSRRIGPNGPSSKPKATKPRSFIILDNIAEKNHTSERRSQSVNRLDGKRPSPAHASSSTPSATCSRVLLPHLPGIPIPVLEPLQKKQQQQEQKQQEEEEDLDVARPRRRSLLVPLDRIDGQESAIDILCDQIASSAATAADGGASATATRSSFQYERQQKQQSQLSALRELTGYK